MTFTTSTIESYVKTLGSVIDLIADPEGAFYKREVGSYLWQQQGGFKGGNYIGKMLSLSGSNIDPVTTLRNFKSFEDR